MTKFIDRQCHCSENIRLKKYMPQIVLENKVKLTRTLEQIHKSFDFLSFSFFKFGFFFFFNQWNINFIVKLFKFQESGEYKICFSNEFSTFTDKSIFLSFITGKKDTRFEHLTDGNSSTYIEFASDWIHSNLEHVINSQTQFRIVSSV